MLERLHDQARRTAVAAGLAVLASASLLATVPQAALASGAPTVTNVSPNRGTNLGGTPITITGTNFTGATAVYFGTTPGSSLIVGSTTSITVTTPAHVSATIDITVATPSGTSPTGAADVYTYEAVLFTDSFTHSTTDEPMYLPAGTGATNVACLTAGTVVTSAPVPACAASGGDADGAGVLRLTTNTGNQEGAAFYATSLPTSEGLDLTFNTYQYASPSQADGIAFALGATDPLNPGAPVNMGPAGGHLGYSGGGAAPGGVGLAHGYMGFGLDVYGNFTNRSYEGSGCADPAWATNGVHAENITVRGPGNGTAGYCMLDSTLNPAHAPGLGTFKLNNPTGTDATRSTSLVPVEVALNPSTAPVITTSGITIPATSWAVRVTPLGGTPNLMTGSLPNVANGVYPSSWINTATGMPYMLTFGWVASTGGSTDIHAVSNVTATTLQPLSATIYKLTNTDSGSSSLSGGASYTSTLTATLDASSEAEKHPVTVSGTYPIGLVPTAVSASGGWTNCQVTGQTVGCTYPASDASPIATGTTLPPIQVDFTVKAGASQTTNATVVQGQVTASDALPAAGNDYTTVSYGTPTVASMAPTAGPISGGTAVVITGTNMYGVTGVQFDATLGTGITYNSNTQLTVYSPAHAAAAKSVLLKYGTSSTVSAGTFTWNAAAPTVTSISPNNGPVAGGTSVTITGAGFTGTTSVTFGGVAAATFIVNSPTSITATSPAESAGQVVVNVTTPSGTASTAPAAGFLYYITPTVSGLAPIEGPTTGFTTVNITGTGFVAVTSVDFGGSAAAGYTVNSDTSITASSPMHAAGPSTVHLAYGGGTAVAGTFTYIGPPLVTAMAPTVGPALGGTTVTVTGTNLQGSAVTVGGVAATDVAVAADGTSLTFVTPANPAGAAAVTIGAVAGTVSAGTFTYVPAPVISGLAPTSGPEAGGTSVVITGTKFNGATAVTFGGTGAASFTVASDTEIDAVTAAGAGAVSVSVTTVGGSATSTGTFTFIPAPVITGMTPTSGPEVGGTTVVITGTGFALTTAVDFGATPAATFTVDSATQITAVTPAGTGTVTLSVTTANGVGTSVGTFGYVPAPSISGLAPTSGPESGGTSVVITGTGFTSASDVSFGATPATSFVVDSATQITAVTPAGTGLVAVRVTTANGTAVSFGAYSYVPAPTITTLTPSAGPEAGGTVTVITGTGFTPGAAVSFGTTPAASVTVDSATQITAITAAGTGTVNVQVTTIGGSTISPGTFTFDPPPVVTGVAPPSGPEAGGTSVTITGTGFTPSSTVSFGATSAATVTVNSPTQITAVTPAGTGTVTVSVTTANGTGTSVGAFGYLPAPSISGLTPTSGPETGGTASVITGTGFTGTTAVRFGGIAATLFTVDSDTQITATSPAGVGAVSVSVTTIGGPATTVGTFTYLPNAGGGGGGGLTVTRIGGPDRDATANLISQAMYPTPQSAKVVILARDDVFADALAGSPMSNVYGGPVLLTSSTTLGASAQDGIVRALNPGDTVYVLGGTAAISAAVVAQINHLGYVTVRIGGADRFATAALIAARLSTSEVIARVYLATGINFPDALSAASAAGSSHGVILLTADAVMPGATSSWLAAHPGLPQLAIGSQAALAAPAATALKGTDRYGTATAVAAATYPAPTGLLLTTGVDFPDALAGAAYAAQQKWGLLLLNPHATSVPPATADYLRTAAASVATVVILGGTEAVPQAAADLVVGALTGA